MFVPPAVPFWGSGGAEGARSFLFGAPIDITGTGRLGARHGPAAVRAASHNIESYSSVLRADLFDAGFTDVGDLDVVGHDLSGALEAVRRAVATLAAKGRAFVLGGEHTISLAIFDSLSCIYPDLALISLDAHLDLADELEGRSLAHGTWAARLGERYGFDRLSLLGVRSGTREEWRRAEACTLASPELVIPEDVRAKLRARPIHLSIDVDVVDPSAAPGTGCPEPGGPTARELFDFLYDLRDLRVVGVDVTEILPEVDPAAITATLAAKLVREAAILWSDSPL